jgi:hypothetical protein
MWAALTQQRPWHNEERASLALWMCSSRMSSTYCMRPRAKAFTLPR